MGNHISLILTIIITLFPQKIIPNNCAILPYPTQRNYSFTNKLNVVTFNTWALPIELPNHNHKNRFQIIPSKLSQSNSDIICLQETFHPNLRKQIINNLHHEYYMSMNCKCNMDIIPFIKKDCYGGLITLSKYPITTQYFFKYPINNKTSLIETIGGKGFLFSVIDLGYMKMNVINTHLYAGNDTESENRRLEQIVFMHQIIKTIPEYNQYPTLLLGDLNFNHPNIKSSIVYSYIQNIMSFVDSKTNINENDLTMDCKTNNYVPNHEPRTKLDYIMMNETKTIKILDSKRCFDGLNTVSDHYGWFAELKLIASHNNK